MKSAGPGSTPRMTATPVTGGRRRTRVRGVGDIRPSWALPLGLGVIGGGPTFLGAGLGHSFTSEPVSVAFLSLAFLSLAGGSILYVIVQLVTIAARAGRRELFAHGLLLGLVAGFATDAVVIAAGI